MSHAHPPAPTFARQIAYTLVTLGAMILAFVVYTTSEKAIDAANEARLRTFLLADELHQSSDDLTRMARLYVVSEHPHARQYHQRILDIREGLQARPDGYSGIYWDLMLVNGRPPRPDSTQRISLVELMRQAGFTAEELDILALAKAQSDRLTQIEREAMAARDARAHERRRGTGRTTRAAGPCGADRLWPDPAVDAVSHGPGLAHLAGGLGR